ncbi:hypothetical protein [Plesiocystis pacifica]|uniref:hypothetical protein n=1 Tax=Plesiocystis pacifica TaxID=191768 RepID=UPI001E3C082C|nr:hypothetical protein [Plesiocystis pacifica]
MIGELANLPLELAYGFAGAVELGGGNFVEREALLRRAVGELELSRVIHEVTLELSEHEVQGGLTELTENDELELDVPKGLEIAQAIVNVTAKGAGGWVGHGDAPGPVGRGPALDCLELFGAGDEHCVSSGQLERSEMLGIFGDDHESSLARGRLGHDVDSGRGRSE